MIRKIPKQTTIRKSIRRYAYIAGFTLHHHSAGSIPSGVPGTYSLFDIKMNYYTHKSVDMDTVVRVVTDELYAIAYQRVRNMVKVGDFVFADYDNGEVVNGEVVKIRNMVDGATLSERILLTVKCEQGYRSIYLDKCVSFDLMETAN